MLRELYTIKGRLGREAYLNRYLATAGVLVGTLLAFGFQDALGLGHSALTALLAVASLATLSLVAAAIRRLHDMDRSAWHLVLILVPVYNLYLFLSLLCVKGEEAINGYGLRPEPL
ncbi:MAG: DUF805 domain-containing protein [Rhodothermales bacterium]